jgi:hypothetical protein
MKHLKSIKRAVRVALENHPEYRDNDKKLVAYIYYCTIGSQNMPYVSAMGVLNLIADGTLPFPDHITRVRRKLQEDNPELRGKTWAKRHQLAEEYRQEIMEL